METTLYNNDKHGHKRLKICVSGAAEAGHCGPNAMEAAKDLGREIVRQGGVLVTGATTGFPLWSAMGAKEVGGVSIGLSPAINEREHKEVYRLPTDYMDLIIYTGFLGYPGRDILLVRSSDAVLFGCGRIGTIDEFAISYQDGKVIGVLQGDWEMSAELKDVLEDESKVHDNIVFDTDPKKLVAKVIALVNKNKVTEFSLAGSVNKEV